MRKFLKRKLVMVAMVMVLITSMSAVVFADTTLENGTYSIDVTSSAAMFKVIDGKLNVLDGKMSAVITLSGTGYEKLFMGTQEESMVSNEADAIQYIANEEGKYTFAIPVEALDTEINVAAHSTKNDTWYGRTLTFNSDTVAAIEEVKVEEVEEATQEEVKEVENGAYSIDVTSSAAMFKVIDGKLNVLDGKMSAVITLSGTGYEKLFMGTQEESMVSNEADAIQYIANEEGKYTFAIPVEALDTEINVAAHSTKNDTWYGRTLTFNSDTIAAIEETKVEEVVEATQEEVNPKTGDNNMIMIASIVLVGCAILLLKNKSVTKEN